MPMLQEVAANLQHACSCKPESRPAGTGDRALLAGLRALCTAVLAGLAGGAERPMPMLWRPLAFGSAPPGPLPGVAMGMLRANSPAEDACSGRALSREAVESTEPVDPRPSPERGVAYTGLRLSVLAVIAYSSKEVAMQLGPHELLRAFTYECAVWTSSSTEGVVHSGVQALVRTRASRGVRPPVLAEGVCGSEGVALPLGARGLPTTLSATAAVTAAASAAARCSASSSACCLFSACISGKALHQMLQSQASGIRLPQLLICCHHAAPCTRLLHVHSLWSFP